MLVLLLCICPCLADSPGSRSDIVYPDWTFLTEDPFPLFAPVVNPVLTAADVTDTPASFLADPFIMFVDGIWYMFFEVYLTNPEDANIAVATSLNGFDWTYDRLVLQEEGIFSYPHVFRSNGDYYMIPTVSYAEDVKLYRADSFPYTWSQTAILVDGHIMRDSSILYYDETWWLFVGGQGSRDCYLYYSDSLATGWTEHPMSPIIADDPSKARPAGRFLLLDDNRIIRLAQKCDESYGEAVRAFEVDLLTRSDYAEHEMPESPVLEKYGDGWARSGMHTCDAWWTGEYWIAAVDGYGPGGWSIGIYQSRPLAAADEFLPPGSPGPELGLITPNPAYTETQIALRVPAGIEQTPLRCSIYDLSGRRVRTLLDQSRPEGRYTLTWDGQTDFGNAASPGQYYIRLSWEHNYQTGKITFVK